MSEKALFRAWRGPHLADLPRSKSPRIRPEVHFFKKVVFDTGIAWPRYPLHSYLGSRLALCIANPITSIFPLGWISFLLRHH